MIYYNEFNPESAAMIRQFMTDGLIPNGTVDERSIKEIDPDELKKYTQCHFFAGIAGWTFALQIAKWPTDRPVWTGSCPCQPFSSAGKKKGKADERHLWPVWLNLIRECRPPTIFGEQVASAIAHGWLDDVYQDMEAEGYAVGSAVLPACSVGAPHKRDRLWFVANACDNGCDQRRESITEAGSDGPIGNCGALADTAINGRGQSDKDTKWRGKRICEEQRALFGDNCESHVADSLHARSQGHWGFINQPVQEGREGTKRHPWQSGVWIDCPDGKQRLVEPSIRLLVDGFQHRKPILHALGNAIVPQVAAKFIEATM